MDATQLPVLLDTDQLADYLGVSPRTLETWRRLDEGPRFHRFGKHVRYAEDDIVEWLRTQGKPSACACPCPCSGSSCATCATGAASA